MHGDVGLVLNNVTPSALRFEPPLLVSDDEVDAAVGILARPGGPRMSEVCATPRLSRQATERGPSAPARSAESGQA